MTHDPHALPDDLPVPEDDGAADHLPGSRLPDDFGDGTVVVYLYPRTGAPGVPSPDGWDLIPGARGCTPQSCAFRDHHSALRELGATVVGVSAQSAQEQSEFVQREHIPFSLRSDPALELADELDLPTFEVAGMRLYKRLTLIAVDGVIVKVLYPVFPPDRNASDVEDWLRANPERELVRAEHVLQDAVRRRDMDRLEAMVGPRFTLTTGRTQRPQRDRAEWLRVARSEYVIETFAFDEIDVQRHGDSAVVRSRYRQRGRMGDADRTQPYLMSDVWFRVHGRWTIVGRHVSPLENR